MSFTKTLQILSKIENVDNIKKFNDTKRLPVFEEIVPSNSKGNKGKCYLFEDIKKFDRSQIFERLN